LIKLPTQQKVVLRLVLFGLSNKEIATQLNLSESTVKQHIKSIMLGTSYKSRAQIIANYYLGNYDVESFYLEEF
jgi:DNA-binding NarL/FixJ family response regulator